HRPVHRFGTGRAPIFQLEPGFFLKPGFDRIEGFRLQRAVSDDFAAFFSRCFDQLRALSENLSREERAKCRRKNEWQHRFSSHSPNTNSGCEILLDPRATAQGSKSI